MAHSLRKHTLKRHKKYSRKDHRGFHRAQPSSQEGRCFLLTTDLETFSSLQGACNKILRAPLMRFLRQLRHLSRMTAVICSTVRSCK